MWKPFPILAALVIALTPGTAFADWALLTTVQGCTFYWPYHPEMSTEAGIRNSTRLSWEGSGCKKGEPINGHGALTVVITYSDGGSVQFISKGGLVDGVFDGPATIVSGSETHTVQHSMGCPVPDDEENECTPRKRPATAPTVAAPQQSASGSAIAVTPGGALAADDAGVRAACSVQLRDVVEFLVQMGHPRALVNERTGLMLKPFIGATREEAMDAVAHSSSSPGIDPTTVLAHCGYSWRLAQLNSQASKAHLQRNAAGSTPASLETQWKQQGKDARIIASDGKSAMDCVKLIEVSKEDAKLSGLGSRVLSNQCSGPVEIGWCYSPGDCDTETGSSWTVQAGRSWPVSAEKPIRWAACHGANTTSFVKGSHGLRYYCKAPAKK